MACVFGCHVNGTACVTTLSLQGTSMPINIRQNPSQAAVKSLDQQEDEQRANTFVAFHDMDQPAVSFPGGGVPDAILIAR